MYFISGFICWSFKGKKSAEEHLEVHKEGDPQTQNQNKLPASVDGST